MKPITMSDVLNALARSDIKVQKTANTDFNNGIAASLALAMALNEPIFGEVPRDEAIARATKQADPL